MGTRCLTHIKEDGETLVTVYRQFDGYPTGHGAALMEALASKKLVNGIPMDGGEYVNGMKCAAAYLIASIKDRAGGVYVYPKDASDVWEDYVYTLDGSNDRLEEGISLKVSSRGHTLYDGPLKDFDPEDAEKAEDAA